MAAGCCRSVRRAVRLAEDLAEGDEVTVMLEY